MMPRSSSRLKNVPAYEAKVLYHWVGVLRTLWLEEVLWQSQLLVSTSSPTRRRFSRGDLNDVLALGSDGSLWMGRVDRSASCPRPGNRLTGIGDCPLPERRVSHTRHTRSAPGVGTTTGSREARLQMSIFVFGLHTGCNKSITVLNLHA